jgi:hypothetical protein
MPATLIFDYPTPAVLAGYLRRQLAPAAVAAADADALETVGQLERLVTGLAADDANRGALTARIRALVAALERAQGEAVEAAASQTDDDLAAATVDNIFDLLDDELAE